MEKVSHEHGKPVILVPGNHESYGGAYQERMVIFPRIHGHQPLLGRQGLELPGPPRPEAVHQDRIPPVNRSLTGFANC